MTFQVGDTILHYGYPCRVMKIYPGKRGSMLLQAIDGTSGELVRGYSVLPIDNHIRRHNRGYWKLRRNSCGDIVTEAHVEP